MPMHAVDDINGVARLNAKLCLMLPECFPEFFNAFLHCEGTYGFTRIVAGNIRDIDTGLPTLEKIFQFIDRYGLRGI